MDMDMQPRYHEPLALVIISSISLGIAACFSLWITFDIIRRRGWRTMMWIMIPVYIINALYLYPITIWTYLKYGRPPKPGAKDSEPPHAAHHPPHAHAGGETEKAHDTAGGTTEQTRDASSSSGVDAGKTSGEGEDLEKNGHSMAGHEHHSHQHHTASHGAERTTDHSMHGMSGHNAGGEHAGHDMSAHAHHHDMSSDRPMFATVTIGVCHCGAGCVLGDIIGEWLVYGTGATLSGRHLYPAYLIDFAWAIAFGIVFQYYSIAPMSGDYGLKTVVRAAKADFLSLMFFQLGLFGWMAIYQVAIWKWRLEMDTVTYWWMMQVGMFFGHWTSVPINYWLIGSGIKEPCA